MTAQYAFDVFRWPRDVTEERLVRLALDDNLVAGWYEHVGYGTGGGGITVHGDHEDATEANIFKRAWVRFMRIDTDPEQEIGGFYLEEGDFVPLSRRERGGRLLTFTGRGGLAGLERYTLGHSIYAPDQDYRGTGPNVPDMWTWRGEPWGAMLVRFIEEGLNAPGAPFTNTLTADFTRDLDSNSNGWNELTDYQTRIGTNGLDLFGTFLQMGAVAQCNGSGLISAYRNLTGFRTDRTSATFASGKLRFEAGVNIIDELPKRLHASSERTHVLTRRGDGQYQTFTSGGSGDPFYGYIEIPHTSDTTAVAALAAQWLEKRAQYLNQATVRHIIGDDPTTGKYAPGPSGDYWVLDLATLHTGDDEHDFDEQSIEVASIRFEHDDAGNWFARTQLGAQYVPTGVDRLSESIYSTIISTPHTHPENFCVPTIPPTAPTVLVAWNFNDGTGTTGTRYDDTDTYPCRGRWDGVSWAFTSALLNEIGTGESASIQSPRPACSPGQEVTISARLHNNSGDPHDLELMFYQADGGLLTSPTVATIPSDDTSHIVSGSETAPANTATVGFRYASGLQLAADYVIIETGGSGTGIAGAGLEELVGTSTRAARCGHQHHVTREVAPTPSDNTAAGFPDGTEWWVVDDADDPTEMTMRVYRKLGEDENGVAVWQQEPLPAATGDEIGWFLPEDYGAVGDGSTDDATALQACFDEAAAVHGVVKLGPNEYVSSATLDIDIGPITILGDGAEYGQGPTPHGTSRIRFTNNNAHRINIAAAGNGSILRGFRVQGPGGTQSSGAGVYSKKYVMLERMIVNGCYDGVRLGDESYYSELHHVMTYDHDHAGIQLDAGTYNVVMYNPRTSTSPIGINTAGTQSLKIFGGAVEQHSTWGILLDGTATNGVLIHGVYFENPSATADIRVGDASLVQGVTIEGNFHDDASSSKALSVNLGEGVWIAGNSFEDTGTSIETTANAVDVMIGTNHYAGTNSLAGDYILLDSLASPEAGDVSITDSGGYYTGTDVEAALQEIGASLAAPASGGLVTVDPGTITYDHSGDDVIVEVAALWGFDDDGPYYNDAGVTAGEEAILALDPTTGEMALVPYNP